MYSLAPPPPFPQKLHFSVRAIFKSIVSFFQRLLRQIRMYFPDNQRLQIMSAPLIRIRDVDSGHVLTHAPSLHYPNQPLCWASRAATATSTLFPVTLFLIHWDAAHDASNHTRARLVTARAPHLWLIVDETSGRLTFSNDEKKATRFKILQKKNSDRPRFQICSTRRVLVFQSDTRRAVMMEASKNRHGDIVNGVNIVLEHVPIPPSLYLTDDELAIPKEEDENDDHSNYYNVKYESLSEMEHSDVTVTKACLQTRITHVKIYNASKNFFLASKPGLSLRAATPNDAGWDVFQLFYDSQSQTGRLMDAGGHMIRSDSTSDGVLIGCASETGNVANNNGRTNGNTKSDESDSSYGQLSSSSSSSSSSPSLSRGLQFQVEFQRNADMSGVTFKTSNGYMSSGRRRDGCVIWSNTIGKREIWELHAVSSMAHSRAPRVRVRSAGNGIRELEGTMRVRVSKEVAYDVLTDYNGFKSFISDALDSETLERKSDSKLVVRMVQSHSFLMLTIPLTMILDVTEDRKNGKVYLDLIRGMGTKYYKGMWTVTENKNSENEEEHDVTVQCNAGIAPIVPAPGFLIDGLMMHTVSKSMIEIRKECLRRQEKVSQRH